MGRRPTRRLRVGIRKRRPSKRREAKPSPDRSVLGIGRRRLGASRPSRWLRAAWRPCSARLPRTMPARSKVGALRSGMARTSRVAGAFKVGARLLPLRAVRGGLLSARPGTGLGGALSRRVAHRTGDWSALTKATGELAPVNVPTKHVERMRREALGREVAADGSSWSPPGPNEPLAPTLFWGWMVRVCCEEEFCGSRSARARRLQDRERSDLERRGIELRWLATRLRSALPNEATLLLRARVVG